jgi:hypothetical protein
MAVASGSRWRRMLLCCLFWVGGCGNLSHAEGEDAQRAAPMPHASTAAECARTNLSSRHPTMVGGPPPGRYVYQVRGTRTLVGQERERHSLPRRMVIVITSATPARGLLCFTLQRRFAPTLVETEWFVITPSALYVRRVFADALGSTMLLAPKQPFLVVSGRTRSWSARFSGRVRGRYWGRVVSRGRINVAGTSIRAAHVSFDIRFAGESTGAEHAEYWFSSDRNLLLREHMFERRRSGLDDLRFRYRAALQRAPTHPR